MESAESNIRIPGVLMPSYLRLTSTEEGKSAMKRIRLECGVCKATRFYSIHRGITRIAGVVACEACRQFYQRFKKQPWVLNCNKGGRCYEMDETPKSKCKACWVAHIICRCPVPMGLYNHLVGYLPTELKIMASLIEGLQENNQFKFMENFNPKTSERVRRKKKKVQYFSSSGRNKNQMQQAYHGPDGRILSSGKDLCDCLQPSCPGCHYPCSKCNSGKCGSECRINRKWFYEKVEVEGTQISWMNEYIKKN